MYNTYDTLKQLDYFEDNEYLVKYCQLVEHHRVTKRVAHKTHQHHIIPKSWFKLTNNQINNDLNNLVNLPCREHLLAHYYLCLCTKDPFKYANQLAMMCLLSKKYINIVDKNLLCNLPLYKNIYEDYKIKLQSHYKLYG